MPMATKLGRKAIYRKRLPLKLHDPLITALRDHVTNQKHYISTTAMSEDTKN